MATTRTVWLALGAGALLLTGGCKALGTCSAPLSDATAAESPPLKMPVGLDGPDTREALEIPALREPEVPRGKDDPCLQEPPPMKEPGSQTAPVKEEPADGVEAPPKPRRPVSPPR